MIARATAEAALEAFQEAAARREYGKPVDQLIAELTGSYRRADFLLLGLLLLDQLGADDRQLAAAWQLSGLPTAISGMTPPLRVNAALTLAGELLGPVNGLRLALACLDQGDMFARVTPARLVEVLTWDESQQDPGAAP